MADGNAASAATTGKTTNKAISSALDAQSTDDSEMKHSRKGMDWDAPPPCEQKNMTDEGKALNYYRSIVIRERPDFVPAKVRLLIRVRSEIPLCVGEDPYFAEVGDHECQSNEWGAITVRCSNGKRLGIKPAEFSVSEWRRNAIICNACGCKFDALGCGCNPEEAA